VSSAAQSYSRAGLVLAAVLAADQLAKRLVIATVDRGDSNAVFPGVDIVRVSNKGVAFGAFSGKPVVMIIVAAALAGLVVWFALHAGRPLVWLPTGLLLGGALGNIIDRLRDGAVTDFIKLPLWPAFNLADVAITVGVLALLIVLEKRDASDDPA
jgi:signal peptidase II